MNGNGSEPPKLTETTRAAGRAIRENDSAKLKEAVQAISASDQQSANLKAAVQGFRKGSVELQQGDKCERPSDSPKIKSNDGDEARQRSISQEKPPPDRAHGR